METNQYNRMNHFIAYFRAVHGKKEGEWCYTSIPWKSDKERRDEMEKLERMGYPAAICKIDLLDKDTGKIKTEGYINHSHIMDSPHYETLKRIYGEEGYNLIRG